MQSILRWSLENSAPQDPASERPPAEQQKIDPGIIDMILGRPDAELMKEDMTIATDKTKSEDDRLAALDHLEMLVEQIDNANDLVKLGLWNPLLALLAPSEPSTDIKAQALWIIGTAIQNNPAAQDVYLSYNPVPTLLTFLAPTSSPTLAARSKAIYALSGLLKHNTPAISALGAEGWVKLRDAVRDPEIPIRRKAVFLLNELLTPANLNLAHDPSPPVPPQLLGNASTLSSTPSLHTVDDPKLDNPKPVHANSHAAYLKDPSRSDTSPVTRAAFEQYGIVDVAISALTDALQDPDPDLEEKILRLLHTYMVTCEGRLTDSKKVPLRHWIERERRRRDEWGLSRSDFDELLHQLR